MIKLFAFENKHTVLYLLEADSLTEAQGPLVTKYTSQLSSMADSAT